MNKNEQQINTMLQRIVNILMVNPPSRHPGHCQHNPPNRRTPSRRRILKINPVDFGFKIMKYKDKTDPKFQHLFLNIREDDNPIVIIAKLKE